MKRALFMLSMIAAAFLALSGCRNPATSPESALHPFPVLGSVISDGSTVTATQNPFLYNLRNSSDPAAVWAPTPQGNKVLMVTSCDLKTAVPDSATGNYYPMDKTYLYAMDPLNTGNDTWYDFGDILQESDIPWADDSQNHLWAPDIDFKGSDYYVFVPARVGSTSKQRIAVFTRNADPFGPFNYSDSLHINGFPGDSDPFAYDPGVFHDFPGTAAGDYYLVYCDNEYPSGRIRIAQFTNDGLTQANYLGQIQINGLPSGGYYMEGPDLLMVHGTGDRQAPYVILQFAAKVDGGQQEYIGYAYKTRNNFHADPVNGWDFGGWIQKQIDPSPGSNPSSETAEWTNHATIVPVELPDGIIRHYFMYQYSEGDVNPGDGQMRQVSMREITFNSGLTIQGTGPTSAFSLDHDSYPFDYIKYSGQIVDAAFDSSTSSIPKFYINNPLTSSINNWEFLYYFKTENGKTPVLENLNAPGFTSRLRNFGGNVWAAELRNTGTLAGRRQQPYWGQIPSGGEGYEFKLRYTDNSNFNKHDDYSVGKKGYVNTDRLPVFTSSGKMFGASPKLKLTSAWTSYSGRTLTASTETIDGNHIVVGMPSEAWNTQEWEIEPIPGSDYVRIKDTAWNLFLNVSTQSERERVTLYDLVPGWWSQQWKIIPINSTEVRIQNRWTEKYLTRGDPTDEPDHDRDDYISVWSQTLENGWASQKWLVQYE